MSRGFPLTHTGIRRAAAHLVAAAVCLFAAALNLHGAEAAAARTAARAVPGPHIWSPAGRLATPVPLENRNGHLMAPLRAVAAGVGAAVHWEAAGGAATVSRGGHTLTLRLGQREAVLDGRPLTLARPPYLEQGHLMVPLRDLLTALGVPFRWDGTGVWLEEPVRSAPARQELLLADPGYGIRMVFPDPWQLRGDLAPVLLTLERPGAKLEIYTEQLPPHTSFRSYTDYGHRSVLQGWNGHVLRRQEDTTVGGYPARLVEWDRPALPLRPDLRRYAEWDVQRPGRVVTTFILKADDATWAEARAQVEAMLRSVRFSPPAWGHQFHRPVGAGQEDWRRWENRGHLRWQTPPPGRLMWGLFDAAVWPEDFRLDQVEALERNLGTKFPFLMTYQSIGSPFPTDLVRAAARDGRLVMLTLQPWVPIDPQLTFHRGIGLTYRILRGEFDHYFRQYARALRDFGEPVFIRYGNEMNGDWSAWGGFQYGKDADLYVAEWRHVRRIFAEEGADNAIWVWNPHDVSYPNFKWNHHVRYYPGDGWVDWIGLTGYNVGDAYPADRWRGFREIYLPLYGEYSRLYPGKPFMIGEFASHVSPGDKAAWIREMAATLPGLPNIRIAVWWNGTDGNRRYRFDTSPESLQAFREAVNAPYVVNTVTWTGD